MAEKSYSLPLKPIVDKDKNPHPWYMGGTAAIDPSGSITTTTRLESHIALSGFTGGMIASFLNSAGQALYITPVMQYGVDGHSLFWSEARSPRVAMAHFQVDPTVYDQTAQINIGVFHAPKNRLGSIIDQTLPIVETILEWLVIIFGFSGKSIIYNSTSSALSTSTPAPLPGKYAIHVPSGNYLTALNGGGMGKPTDKLPLHTDATQVGPWEKFKFINLGGTAYAIQTANGHYLTAVNAGGMGGSAFPLNTYARHLGPWEIFRLDVVDNGYYTIKTTNGHYVTAVNGGGLVGEPADTPLHTDATRIASWEKFALTAWIARRHPTVRPR